MATLFVVATPIGNLADITLRALETLRTVDYILAEDTRVTKKLLDHYHISKPLVSYHHHSDTRKVAEIKKLLAEGKNLALVTDAGTPGISDPGNKLVRESLGNAQVQISPIPGPSAMSAALSISGFPTDKFIFLGFPPHKKGRQRFWQEVAQAKYTVVFYESGHRIAKCVSELTAALEPARRVIIGRELTKKFETIYRGASQEIGEQKIDERGEFVVVVSAQ